MVLIVNVFQVIQAVNRYRGGAPESSNDSLDVSDSSSMSGSNASEMVANRTETLPCSNREPCVEVGYCRILTFDDL